MIDYEQFCGLRGQEVPVSAATGNESEVTVEDLKRRLDRQENVFILDVRNPEEYQICRIPGSTLIPLPELPRRIAPRHRVIVARLSAPADLAAEHEPGEKHRMAEPHDRR